MSKPLKSCPDCGREVSRQATTCPGCGRPLARPTSRVVGCLAILLLLPLGFCIYLGLNPGPPSPSGPDWATIKVKCQLAIESRLKAPSTARYTWGEPRNFTGADPKRTGLGYVGSVDAQNAFGAMLRHNFRCWVGADGNATVEFD